MLEIAAPTLHTCKLIFMIHRILFNVCGSLFDELVKEWLQDRYIIVSGSFREIDGRKVLVVFLSIYISFLHTILLTMPT